MRTRHGLCGAHAPQGTPRHRGPAAAARRAAGSACPAEDTRAVAEARAWRATHLERCARLLALTSLGVRGVGARAGGGRGAGRAPASPDAHAPAGCVARRGARGRVTRRRQQRLEDAAAQGQRLPTCGPQPHVVPSPQGCTCPCLPPPLSSPVPRGYCPPDKPPHQPCPLMTPGRKQLTQQPVPSPASPTSPTPTTSPSANPTTSPIAPPPSPPPPTCLEEGAQCHELSKDAAGGPHVHRARVVARAQQQLGGAVPAGEGESRQGGQWGATRGGRWRGDGGRWLGAVWCVCGGVQG